MTDSEQEERSIEAFSIMSSGTIMNNPLRGLRDSAFIAAIIFAGVLLSQLPEFIRRTNHSPTLEDWLTAAAFAVFGFLLWLCLPLLVKRSLAERIEITKDEVVIYRTGEQCQQVSWSTMTAVGWDSSQTELMLSVGDSRTWVSSLGFADEEWNKMMAYIRRLIPPGACFVDLTGDFNRSLCNWLERLTPPTVILGILSTLYFVTCGDKVGVILAGGIATTLVIIYAALYSASGLGSFESPVLTFLGMVRFYGIKLIALIPLTVIYLFLLCPAPDFAMPAVRIHLLFYIANGMFFGGMTLAIIVGEGLSYTQFKRRELHGLNIHHRKVLFTALAICITGFIIKMWNEFPR